MMTGDADGKIAMGTTASTTSTTNDNILKGLSTTLSWLGAAALLRSKGFFIFLLLHAVRSVDGSAEVWRLRVQLKKANHRIRALMRENERLKRTIAQRAGFEFNGASNSLSTQPLKFRSQKLLSDGTHVDFLPFPTNALKLVCSDT